MLWGMVGCDPPHSRALPTPRLGKPHQGLSIWGHTLDNTSLGLKSHRRVLCRPGAHRGELLEGGGRVGASVAQSLLRSSHALPGPRGSVPQATGEDGVRRTRVSQADPAPAPSLRWWCYWEAKVRGRSEVLRHLVSPGPARACTSGHARVHTSTHAHPCVHTHR